MHAAHMCLRSQLEAFLLVCAQTWQPQQMCLKVCGQPELLTYQEWVQWETAHTRSDQSLPARKSPHMIHMEIEPQDACTDCCTTSLPCCGFCMEAILAYCFCCGGCIKMS